MVKKGNFLYSFAALLSCLCLNYTDFLKVVPTPNGKMGEKNKNFFKFFSINFRKWRGKRVGNSKKGVFLL